MLSVIIPSLILAMTLGQEAPAMPLVVQEIQEKVDYSKKWDEIIEVPKGVDLLEEKYLPYVPPNLLHQNTLQSITAYYGMRRFCVEIAPGQTLRATVNLAFPIENYINFCCPTDTKDPMFSNLKKAWKAQGVRRLPYIEFKNTTKTIYKLTFFVFGSPNHPYWVKLNILEPSHL
jgi:hypothetical protein